MSVVAPLPESVATDTAATSNRPPPTPASRLLTPVLVVVLGLTMLAGAIRLSGLAAPDGRMDTDEARVALAADGVLRTGLPVMPSGRVYTRGLLNAYAIAGSFALFGRGDFAARLPSVAAGALLVPVVFLLGRAFGGTAAGLAVASFAALADPLVSWSRNAWVSSVFLLLFTLSVYYCYKGFVERSASQTSRREGAGWQVAGAACFLLALLSYEFAVLLLGGLALYLGGRAARRDWSWYRGRATLVALGLLIGGLLLFVALALLVRAGTLAGPLGEVREFFSPRVSLNAMRFYLQDVLFDYYVLIALAFLGLPLLARSRPGSGSFLVGLLAVAFLVPSFAIQVKWQSRYVAPVLPLLAVLAAAGTVQMARLAGRRLDLAESWRRALPALALLAVFGLALRQDAAAAARRFQMATPGPTWLQAFKREDLQPLDLLVAEAPTIVYFYLGRDEFWIRHEDYERYVYRAPDTLRSIYTDSTLLTERGDFERLIEQPYSGRSVWFLSRRDRLQYMSYWMDQALWPSLVRSADEIVETRDGWLLLKVGLPRRNGPG